MRRLLTVLAIAATATALLAVPASAQSPAVGTWSGSLALPNGASLPLVFHVEESAGTLNATWDSPAQGANGIPASAATFVDGVLSLEMANIGASYRGTLSEDGATIQGIFSQSGMELPLDLTRGEVEAPVRPQEPEGPLPYREVQVRFPSVEGVELAGTLTVPPGAGPFPAAVLVSGSGPQDRNEALMGHKPFLVLADHLTRQGIAVLRYDDRGVGESTGTFGTATSRDFADDALAAVRYLRQRGEVTADAVGILGHSEGGLVGPMAAAVSDEVRWVIMLAGPGLPGEEILRLQGDLIARAGGASEEAIAANAEAVRQSARILREESDPQQAAPRLRAAMRAAMEAMPDGARPAPEAMEQALDAQVSQMNSPWFRFFLEYDPRPTLMEVRVPVLALLGGKDLQVPAPENAVALQEAFAAGGNPDATVVTLEGLNHLFQAAESGAPGEYSEIEETMNPRALEEMSRWILERFASGH